MEKRIINAEFRLAANGSRKIGGRAIAYNSLSTPIPAGKRTFRERILPGACARVLEKGADVRCLYSHNDERLLGRTASGTLRLSETRDGLDFECDLPNTSDGDDCLELVQRGDLRGCSFGFALEDGDDDFSEEDYDDEDGKRCRGAVRSIRNISHLLELSLVSNPAYSATRVGMRSVQVSAVDTSDEVVARIAAAAKKVVDAAFEKETQDSRRIRLYRSLL